MKPLSLRKSSPQDNLKLIQENLQLKGHMGDLKKGHDKLTKDRAQLKLQIADMLKAEEKNKQKMKGIQAILDE